MGETGSRNEGVAETPETDVEALRVELDELRRENTSLRQERRGGGRWRPPIALLLVVIGSLLAAAAVPAVWLNRTIMNTDRWVATVAPLSEDPAIQDAVADWATDEVFKRVDVEQTVRENLPPRATFLAAPIAAQVQNFVGQVANRVTQSPKFSELWAEANRRAHPRVISVLTGREGRVVTTTGGNITVDLSAVIAEVRTELENRGLTRVAAALAGVGGTYTIAQSPALAQASQYLGLLNNLALILPILAIGALVGGVALAIDRRRALLWTGVGLVIGMLVLLLALILARSPYESAVGATIPSAAALAVYDTILSGLRNAVRVVLVLGLILSIGAVVAGPSASATRFRSAVQGGMREVGADWDFGSFGDWVRRHKAVLRAIGVIAGIGALLLWGSPGIAGVLWVALAVVIWILAVEFFGREPPRERAARRPERAEKPEEPPRGRAA